MHSGLNVPGNFVGYSPLARKHSRHCPTGCHRVYHPYLTCCSAPDFMVPHPLSLAMSTPQAMSSRDSLDSLKTSLLSFLSGFTSPFTSFPQQVQVAQPACSSLLLRYTSASLQCMQLLSPFWESKALGKSTSHALCSLSVPHPQQGAAFRGQRWHNEHPKSTCSWLRLVLHFRNQTGTSHCSQQGEWSNYC